MSDLSTSIDAVPGVGGPAARALAEQGLATVGDLVGADWTQLAQLHGVGPAAGRRLQQILEEHGESLTDPPAPRSGGTTVTRGSTGRSAKDITTHATTVDPAEYVAGLSARRSHEGQQLLELFGEATGERAVMWGPSMIGYGESHYVYASGREGDTFHLGFSPRTADIALYGLSSAPRSEELLDRLGKHRRGAACVWIRKLEDVDRDVLRELVEHAWASDPTAC
ncbi:MAG: DUF1801 domain-containing protein [Brachybacterium tyrofermentans]|uniref:DUF1801 domain-containing protein n=1 Tax=Brachybacterium tyrofermentans TaxID=47848 RepID=A0ABW0FEX0_9MICO|nr:DUF1801 domain-containing protein [Brachybacterium tyrofermentans]SLN05427.1 hypothetical protein FM103_20095 [Corynebacterium xerosis]